MCSKHPYETINLFVFLFQNMKKYCVYVRNCKNILKGVLKYVKLRGYNILLLAVWSEIESPLMLRLHIHRVKWKLKRHDNPCIEQGLLN